MKLPVTPRVEECVHLDTITACKQERRHPDFDPRDPRRDPQADPGTQGRQESLALSRFFARLQEEKTVETSLETVLG